jgi:hypothetical protein
MDGWAMPCTRTRAGASIELPCAMAGDGPGLAAPLSTVSMRLDGCG